MSNHWKDYWQEHHQGEKEYCRESGPLNSRKISAAKAKSPILANGLGLVSSTLAAIGLAAAIATLYITSAPVNITEHSASVNISVHNRQEEEQIQYVLLKEVDPDTPIDSGVIGPDEDTLEFDDLESNTTYIIEYFAERDGALEKVGEFRFTTDGPDQEPTSTPAGNDPPSTTEGDLIPPITEPEEETREQHEETTGEEEETTLEEETTSTEVEITTTETEATTTESETTTTEAETTITEAETTTTEAETTTQQPTTTQPVPPTTTEPETQPGETETEGTTPEPEIPDNSIQVSAELLSVIPGGGKYADYYLLVERHTFTNVSSPNAMVTVEYNGQEVDVYERSYDETTGTLVIQFTGYEIPAGESGISNVVLQDVDDRNATSGLTVQAPNLQSLDLTVIPNGDGTYTFTVSGEVIQPSHGSLSYEAWIYSGAEEHVTETFTGSGSTYTHSAVMRVNAVGAIYADAEIFATWSLQDPTNDLALYIGAEDEVGYEVAVGSSMTFTLKSDLGMDYEGVEHLYYRYPYEYDVTAAFAGLGEITPISVEFVRRKADCVLNDNLEYVYEYSSTEPESIATVTDLVVADDGTVRASYNMPDQEGATNYEDVLWENGRHDWTAILRYADRNGAEHRVELNDYLASAFYSVIKNDGTLRRLENGSYEAELDLKFSIVGGSHGGMVLDYVVFSGDSIGGEYLQVKEWTMQDGVLRVKGTAPEAAGFSYSYNVYAHWAPTNYASSRTTGSSLVFMTPSHSYQTSAVMDDAGAIVGYETEEVFTFAGADEVAFSTMDVVVSHPENVRDMEITFDETADEIRVRFVRFNQQLNADVTSEIKVSYKIGYLDEYGVLHEEESRRIETYEEYRITQ